MHELQIATSVKCRRQGGSRVIFSVPPIRTRSLARCGLRAAPRRISGGFVSPSRVVASKRAPLTFGDIRPGGANIHVPSWNQRRIEWVSMPLSCRADLRFIGAVKP